MRDITMQTDLEKGASGAIESNSIISVQAVEVCLIRGKVIANIGIAGGVIESDSNITVWNRKVWNCWERLIMIFFSIAEDVKLSRSGQPVHGCTRHSLAAA